MNRIDRKGFLTWTLGSAASMALGCSAEDPVPPPASGGTGGSFGGSGGAAGGTGGSFVNTSGSGGTGGAAGGSGGAAGGSGGAAGGTGGAAGGTGGAAGGSAGAGGSGGTPPIAPNCSTELKVFISANHMHVMNVTTDDVMAGVDKVYDTEGASGHPHWVRLTAADFTKLKAGGTVRKVSCNDGHEHEFIVNCVGVAAPDTTSGIANFCDPAHSCGDINTNFCPELP